MVVITMLTFSMALIGSVSMIIMLQKYPDSKFVNMATQLKIPAMVQMLTSYFIAKLMPLNRSPNKVKSKFQNSYYKK